MHEPPTGPFGRLTFNLQHLHGPGHRIVPGPEIDQVSGSTAHHERNELTVNRATPDQRRHDGIEDRGLGRQRKRSHGIKRPQGQLHRTSKRVLEVELERAVNGQEPLRAEGEADCVTLETMATPGLSDSLTSGQGVKDLDQISSQLGLDVGCVVSDDAGQQYATGPRGRIDREVSEPERHPSSGGDRPGMEDFEFGNNHEQQRYFAIGQDYRRPRCANMTITMSKQNNPFDLDEFRLKPGHDLSLSKLDTRATPFWDPDDKESARLRLLELNDRLEELQELLWAQGRERVLVVLQAMDAGGKDGTIRRVFEGVDPSGVRVAAFKQPTERELAHDYLWRVHSHVPGSGELVIFNRSHYEDVLVVRVMDLVPKSRWSKRYRHIVNFEQMLADEGTTIIKLFLHISKKEQRERLQARLDEEEKNWKFEEGDLVSRARWDEYQEAFEDVISATSTKAAPWYIVPADRKWYRNLVVSEILIQTLEGLKMSYPPAPPNITEMVIPQ